jgi:biotin transport system substrate-specific component
MTTNTLASSLWPRSAGSVAAKAALVVMGVLALAVSSKVQVPFWPVPMTLQTAVVLLIGASYGARLAAATLLSYLAAGALGLPVLASGAGLAYMAGPTGGYLVGFLLAATVMAVLSDKGFGRTPVQVIALMLLGEILIFAPGIAWLAGFAGMEKAIAAGLLPFLPGETLKAALAAALLAAGWSAASRH